MHCKQRDEKHMFEVILRSPPNKVQTSRLDCAMCLKHAQDPPYKASKKDTHAHSYIILCTNTHMYTQMCRLTGLEGL